MWLCLYLHRKFPPGFGYLGCRMPINHEEVEYSYIILNLNTDRIDIDQIPFFFSPWFPAWRHFSNVLRSVFSWENHLMKIETSFTFFLNGRTAVLSPVIELKVCGWSLTKKFLKTLKIVQNLELNSRILSKIGTTWKFYKDNA